MSKANWSPVDQRRKEAADRIRDDIRAVLADYYAVPARRVVSVESFKDGPYDTDGEWDPIDFIDYSGIDWLVDVRPEIVGVSDRVREHDTTGRDFAWRVENDQPFPCEADRVPAGLANDGIAPQATIFSVAGPDGLERAWLIDMRDVCRAVAFDELAYDVYQNDDGTAAAYLSLPKLVDYGAVLDSWEGDDV